MITVNDSLLGPGRMPRMPQSAREQEDSAVPTVPPSVACDGVVFPSRYQQTSQPDWRRRPETQTSSKHSGTVAKHSGNGLAGTGFATQYRLQPKVNFVF